MVASLLIKRYRAGGANIVLAEADTVSMQMVGLSIVKVPVIYFDRVWSKHPSELQDVLWRPPESTDWRNGYHR